ncbi:MAG: type II secretion system F family protein [Chloroflexi bacterium]|nr:type II secretion system F family protein [Chloroflexota bacterium]
MGPNILLLLLVAGIFVLTAGLALLLTASGETPAERLARFTQRPGSPGAAVETMGAGERLFVPLVRRVVNLAASVAPQHAHKAVQTDLAMAGLSMSPTVFLAVQTGLMLGLPLVALTQVLGSGHPTMIGWGLVGMSALVGRRLPSMWVKRKMRARQRAIDRELPYALDLMVACLEGGLSLDASLAKVVEQSSGPLAVEVRKTLQEMQLGRPGAEALRDLGERNGAPGLKLFTGNVVQAERMGISIAETMRVLAQESRVKRRQEAEEMARKAPIKMVPVLIFCVLPALGIVVMAPAVLTVMRIMGPSHS